MARWPSVTRAVIAASVVLAVGIPACRDRGPTRGRVLLVGIDGATLRVAGPLIEEGRLPVLAKVAREGISGALRTFPPLVSPRIWASVATGQIPERHGITQFVVGEGDDRRLMLSTDRKVAALWNIASDAGLTVGVVNWWTTYPPEKVNGVMISDHFRLGPARDAAFAHRARLLNRAPVIYPEEWNARLDQPLAALPSLASISLETGDAEDIPDFVSWNTIDRCYETDRQVIRVALEVEAAIRPDLLMVYLKGIDPVSHLLFGFLEPERLPEASRVPPHRRRAAVALLRHYYEFTDRLLGILIERYASDDLVVVASDHGFEAGESFGKLTGLHVSDEAAEGIVFARGPGLPAGAEVHSLSVVDLAPTILAWLGLPVARTMAGRPAASLDSGEVEWIPSFDAVRVERVGSGPSGSEKQMMDELRSLGYIE